jgi:hypothetical protein
MKEKQDKEKLRDEREHQEREPKEAKRRAFREGMKEERKKAFLEVGMNVLDLYLLLHRKGIEPIDNVEKEEVKRYLERELKEEIEGNETDHEVWELANEILNEFFFKE